MSELSNGIQQARPMVLGSYSVCTMPAIGETTYSDPLADGVNVIVTSVGSPGTAENDVKPSDG